MGELVSYEGQRRGEDVGVGVLAGLGELVRRVEARGLLRQEGIWRLHPEEARGLSEVSGGVPAGGWAALAGVAAGAGVLRAQPGGLGAGSYVAEVRGWTEEEARQRLLEGFLRWLTPPGAAASWLLALGVHPMWGVRLVGEVQREAPWGGARGVGWRDEGVMEVERLEALRRQVFVSLAVVVGMMGERGAGVESEEALVTLCEEAMRFARRAAREVDVSTRGGLKVWVAGVERRAVRGAVRGLLGEVLVPAGWVRWEVGGRFEVAVPGWPGWQVGAFGEEEQQAWLRLFLRERGTREGRAPVSERFVCQEPNESSSMPGR
ncbi:hypothetical protein [Lujinxingia litoralis]|nr:hypothetical protein [Lujinxingia litoralis]